MFLISIKNMPQIYAPDNVVVGADASHQMPPAMSLKKETPGHADTSAPTSQGRAVHVVEVPEVESAEENTESETHKDPHGLEYVSISLILVCLLFFADHVRYTCSFSFETMFLLRSPY